MIRIFEKTLFLNSWSLMKFQTASKVEISVMSRSELS